MQENEANNFSDLMQLDSSQVHHHPRMKDHRAKVKLKQKIFLEVLIGALIQCHRVEVESEMEDSSIGIRVKESNTNYTQQQRQSQSWKGLIKFSTRKLVKWRTTSSSCLSLKSIEPLELQHRALARIWKQSANCLKK